MLEEETDKRLAIFLSEQKQMVRALAPRLLYVTGMRPRRSPLICATLSLTALVATGACAPARGGLTPRELRQTFGVIAVTTGGVGVQHRFQRPITSSEEGAAVAAKAAAGESGRFMVGALIDPTRLIVLPLLPFFIAGHAIAGAAAAESPVVAETSAIALNWAVKELDFDTTLRDRLRDQLARRGNYDVVFREPEAGEAIRTLLRISVTSVRLAEAGQRAGSVNPSLYLQIVARMDVLERDEHGASRLRASQHVSSVSGRRRVLRDWAAADARVFKERVREELDEIAGKIADTLLHASR